MTPLTSNFDMAHFTEAMMSCTLMTWNLHFFLLSISCFDMCEDAFSYLKTTHREQKTRRFEVIRVQLIIASVKRAISKFEVKSVLKTTKVLA